MLYLSPKYLKAIRGKKTDKKDTKWITDIFKHDLVPDSCTTAPGLQITPLEKRTTLKIA